MRAGTYVLGDSASGCPSGSMGIVDYRMCQSAAAALGSTAAITTTADCSACSTCDTCTACTTACPAGGCTAIESSGTISSVQFGSGSSGKPICLNGPPRSAPQTSAPGHRDPSLVLPGPCCTAHARAVRCRIGDGRTRTSAITARAGAAFSPRRGSASTRCERLHPDDCGGRRHLCDDHRAQLRRDGSFAYGNMGPQYGVRHQRMDELDVGHVPAAVFGQLGDNELGCARPRARWIRTGNVPIWCAPVQLQ